MTKTLKKNKAPLIAGLVLVLFLVAYFYRDNLKKVFQKNTMLPSNTNTASLVNTASTGGSSSSNSGAGNDIVLSKGNNGLNTQKLQRLLNDKHRQNTPTFIPLLVEDGKFGAKTETMLKKYTGKTSISINELIKALK